jgi:DNA replication and repair protein RecF
MYISSLKLDHFRNYDSLDLEFSPGTNLFYGDNAQGKTNILEAVYFCGTARSHRTSRDSEMIRFDANEAHLRMVMKKRSADYRIDMHLKAGKAKGIAINGSAIRKAQELVGLGHFIFFSPEDLGMIKNGPQQRRHFLDMELCQLDRIYVSSLAGYTKVLQQRNRLLKDLSFRPQDIETLDVWDEQLVRYGSVLIGAREAFVKRLGEIIRPIHLKLSGGREELDVGYEKNVDRGSFADAVRKGRDKDLLLKSTGTGPHRDDMSFQVNGIDIRKYGSQGQQRSAALSLKLAEIELVQESTGDVPVLLLDDVLSELDTGRQHYLLDSIGHIQTFITCTGLEEYENSPVRIDRILHVSQGHVSFAFPAQV